MIPKIGLKFKRTVSYYGEIEKEGISTMFGVTVFSQYYFAVMAGLVIGTFLGGGSIILSNSRLLKHVSRQVWGQHVPRSFARSMMVSLVLSSILLTIGALALIGLLARNVSVTGMIVNWWVIVFIASCGLVTLSAHIPAFIVRKRRERSRRLAGRGMEGEEQSVRSRPLRVPKEAREEE